MPTTMRLITAMDHALLERVAWLRNDPLTEILQAVDAVGSLWTIRIGAWGTLLVLLVSRRFQHLATYLAVMLSVAFLVTALPPLFGRMRPGADEILGHWTGYSHPSRPAGSIALVFAGIVYMLIPAGRLRTRAIWVGSSILLVFAFGRLYLGVDHPSDLFAAFAVGCALPVIIFRLVTPDEVFPVSYRRGQRAHLAIEGRRASAIVEALDHQLGLTATDVAPFGLAGSAGSTPLRITIADQDGHEHAVFAKLYALGHLRSDRWYKLGRSVLYGRLEDEKPFNTVRRLLEYEDHMLRLLRDAGLPTPAPIGFVELTPEREYVLLMEFFAGAREIGDVDIDDDTILEGLEVVRRLWDAGVAHRDIKPSNILVRDGSIFLIDVAFAAVRPTPWRQAVDLANMMLTLALSSSAERVYRQALSVFAPDDVAEAFAASRSVTVPTQLRTRLRSDGRRLFDTFRALAPERAPVSIQLWSIRRLVLTLGLLAAVAMLMVLLFEYGRTVGLL